MSSEAVPIAAPQDLNFRFQAKCSIIVHTGVMKLKSKTNLRHVNAKKRKHQEFLELAERFRSATDPQEARRLAEELGRLVFGARGTTRDAN